MMKISRVSLITHRHGVLEDEDRFNLTRATTLYLYEDASTTQVYIFLPILSSTDPQIRQSEKQFRTTGY